MLGIVSRPVLAGGVALAVLAVSCLAAKAQQTPAAQGAAQAAGVAPSLSNQIPPPASPSRPLPAPPNASLCPFADSSLKVTLTKVVVDGATVVTPGQIDAAVAGYLGKERDLRVVCEVRDRVADLFAARGYRLTRIDLPPQRIQGGELHLQATEGFVADVDLKSLARLGPSKALATAYLSSLLGKRPTPWTDIEREVLLTRDIPGAEVGIRLHAAPGEAGAVELVADSANRRRFDISTGVQELGSEELGRTALYARFDANSFTPYGERTSLVLYDTTIDAQRVIEFTESLYLGASGLNGDFAINYASTHPGGVLAPLDLDGNFLSTRTGLTYPFLRSQAFNVVGGLHFETIDLKNDLGVFQGLPGGAPTLFEDRLRILSAELDGRVRPSHIPPLTADFTLELRQGIAGLGASHEGDPDLSRAQGDPAATEVRADGTVRWTFGGRPRPDQTGGPWVQVRGAAQWTNRPLLAYEEFQIGNYTIGRGYDPGAATGDRAIGGQFEAGWPILFKPARQPGRANPLWFEPYVFYDVAHLTNLSIGGYTTTVSSVGGGVRVRLPWELRLDAAYGDPLSPPFPGAARPPGRLLFTLTRVFSFY
jgi:hemolysin activation/secretion protein